jgi:glycosyltransferase involved in cell wall biosynthesis
LKVTLSLGSQSFQKAVALRLLRDGMLSRVLSLGIDAEILEPDGDGGLNVVRHYSHYRQFNRILWAAWRRLPGSKFSRHFPVVISTTYADWLLSRKLSPCDIFHGWNGVCFASLRAARRNGAVTMIENPSMHPRDWQKAVLAECGTFGVRRSECRAVLPSALIRRMEAEFAIGDYIVVPSTIARDSFVRAGWGKKALVVHAGIDAEFFKPSPTLESREVFRVCYTGRVEIAKGVAYLLQAWKQLGLPKAELVLIGEVAAEMQSLVREYATPNVRFMGFLPADRVADWYRNSDVFAFPSVNEGLARVLLEAMACGLPVIATKASGAEDCVTPGADGTIVPERDPGALADAILWHFENRDALRAMGGTARAKIESRFTVAHYVERMMRTYCSLLKPENETENAPMPRR